MNTLKGDRPSVERPSDFPKDEEITRPEGVNVGTAWGRLASIFADLDPRESHEAATLLLNWTKAGPEGRVLIAALARLLKDK